MSESRFPNPRTSIFNPLAWDFTLLDKYANFIVAYRYAQSYPIFFGGSPTLTTRTALTQWADTAYATNEISAWVSANVTPILGTAQVWAILQYYFGGIAVNTINPLTTGGTLLIGNSYTTNQVGIHSKDGRSTVLHLGDGNTSTGGIHINNGTDTTGDVNILNGTGSTGTITLGSSTATTRLNCPLTPLYAYPIGTATGLNTPSIGTPGTIGFIPATTWISNSANEGGGGSGHSLRSVSLSPGVWALYGYVQYSRLGQTSLPSILAIFSTTINGSSGAADVGRKGTQQINNAALAPNMFVGMTTGGTVSLTTTTTYYFNVRALFAYGGFTTQKTVVIAVRIG